MTKEEYFGDWSKVINLKEADRILRKLSASKHIICPQVKDIFKAFHLCSLRNLRVVIIGQDPYNDMYKGVPRATGLAFANPPGTPEDSYSPSLSVLTESVIDFTKPHGVINFDPSLKMWEKQGVLLLNSALSCQKGMAGSHTLLWRPFIKNLLTNLSWYMPGIVYVLMGSQAQTLESYINKKNNYIFSTKHPSWYAREHQRMPSDIWRSINDILISQNGYGIKWF